MTTKTEHIECSRCVYFIRGKSRIDYCHARGVAEFAHAMRMERAPCGPGGALFSDHQESSKPSWEESHD